MDGATVANQYCTYFDQRFLSRGVAMIQSLVAVEPEAVVNVLALSDGVEQPLVERLGSSVRVVGVEAFEATVRPIAHLRAERSAAEYIFSLTAAWTLYVMDQFSRGGEWTTYIDADMWFFTCPAAIYEELEGSSVGIVEHRYPWSRRSLTKYGTYNVGWVSFRKDEDGRRCLQWWDERSREWCFDRVEDGKFADQGYLDRFHTQTDRVSVIRHPGVDLAPWNLGRHRVTYESGSVTVDGRPLVLFHFHGVSRHGDRFFWKNSYYHARTTGVIRERIFRPYLETLHALDEEVGVAPSGPRERHGGGGVARVRERAKRGLAMVMGDTLQIGTQASAQ